jgi:WD40 repeat protein
VWNRSDGSIRQGFYDVPFAARASDEGSILLGDDSGGARLWSLETGTFREIAIHFPKTKNAWAAITPDAAYVLHADFGNAISIWDVETGVRIGSVAADWSWHCATVSRQNTLVLADHEFVKEYDITSAMLKNSVLLPEPPEGRASAGAVVFSPDDKRLYLGDAAARLQVIDWNEHKLVRTDELAGGSIHSLAFYKTGNPIYIAQSGRCSQLQLSEHSGLQVQQVSDQTAFAITASAMVAFGLNDGRISVRNGSGESRMKGGPRVDATCFAYSPNGDRIALAGRDGQIAIRTTDRWEQTISWKGHLGWIRRIAWAPNGKQLATLGDDAACAIWDANTGKELHAFTVYGSSRNKGPTYDDGGLRLALPTLTRGESIKIYDAQDFAELSSIPRAAIPLRGNMLFSPEGKLLYAGSSLAKSQVWNFDTNAMVASMGTRSIDDVKLALSRSGDTIFSVDERDIEAFDTATARRRWILKRSARRVFDIPLHPNGSLLAAGTSDGTVYLIDPSTGTLLQTLRFGPTAGEMWQVDFSPDGKLLTVAASNGSVIVIRTPDRLSVTFPQRMSKVLCTTDR